MQNLHREIQLLKSSREPTLKILFKFEFKKVRLSWFSLCRFFIGAQNWDLCQVSADTKNLNSTLENLSGALDSSFCKFELNWVRLSWFSTTCPLTDRVRFSSFWRTILTADWQLLTAVDSCWNFFDNLDDKFNLWLVYFENLTKLGWSEVCLIVKKSSAR